MLTSFPWSRSERPANDDRPMFATTGRHVNGSNPLPSRPAHATSPHAHHVHDWREPFARGAISDALFGTITGSSA